MKALEGLLSREVVVDTEGPLVYLGTLKAVTEDCLELAPVDVHDTSESGRNKENYIRTSRQTGIRHNRGSCLVDLRKVVSVSPLADVLVFP